MARGAERSQPLARIRIRYAALHQDGALDRPVVCYFALLTADPADGVAIEEGRPDSGAPAGVVSPL